MDEAPGQHLHQPLCETPQEAEEAYEKDVQAFAQTLRDDEAQTSRATDDLRQATIARQVGEGMRGGGSWSRQDSMPGL